FGSGNFFTTVRDPPHTAEQHTAEWDDVGNTRQHAVGEHRQRIAGEFGAISELLKRDARQQKHRRAANLSQTINMVEISFGIVVDALACLSNQFIPLAKLGGPRRASFRTRSW